MKIKFLLIILIIFISLTILGCLGRPSSSVSYAIFITPSEGYEATLTIPLVIDNKSGEIDQVIRVRPISTKGNPVFDIVETDKGPALRIITHEVAEIWFSKDYKESGAELRANKTLSMTNITYDERGKPIIKSWVYLNSTANQTTHFLFTLMAGYEDRIRKLDISGRNVSNGWHQITVEEGYGIS